MTDLLYLKRMKMDDNDHNNIDLCIFIITNNLSYCARVTRSLHEIANFMRRSAGTLYASVCRRCRRVSSTLVINYHRRRAVIIITFLFFYFLNEKTNNEYVCTHNNNQPSIYLGTYIITPPQIKYYRILYREHRLFHRIIIIIIIIFPLPSL